MVKKALLLLLIFVSLFMTANASLCIPYLEDAPQVDAYISVYDENINYLGQLDEYNNVIQDNWYLGINLQPTTDDEDNLDFERVHILSNAIYGGGWNYDEVSYSNLANFIQTREHSTNTFDFYEYLTGTSQNGGIGQYFTEEFSFFSGTHLKHAFHNLDSGFYDILLRATDECGLSDYKFIPLQVNPAPNPTSYTCSGSLSVTGDYKDIYIEDSCTDITLDGTALHNSIYYTGTAYSDTNELEVDFITNTNNQEIYMYTGSVKMNFLSVPNYMYIFANNNNFEITTLDTTSGFYLDNFNGTIITPQSTHNFIGGLLDIDVKHTNQFMNVRVDTSYSNFNLSAITGNTQHRIYLGADYRFWTGTSTNNYPIVTKHNTINAPNLADTTYISVLLRENPAEISHNIFNNLDYLKFEEYDIMTSKSEYPVFANTFNFENGGVVEGQIGMFSGDIYLGKNVNGKYLGNMYLDENGNDKFTCSGNVQDITYLGTNYKVCDTPVLLATGSGMMGNYNIYDYIIVTDENAGGGEPTEEPKKPVGIINLDNYNPRINDIVTWDISDSYDNDGTIVNTKFYVDNVLYENVNSSTFTSDVPDTISMTLIVEDNDGLKDTTYRTINFKDAVSLCAGNTEPYAEIQATDLGNDLWRFESVNEFDADGDTILSRVWRINYEDIEADSITTTIGYDQTIYLYLFDGCSEGVDYYRVNSSINEVPDETTEPIVNLNCGLSSQTPVSSLNCNLDYDLRGYDLSSINWYYDGNELLSQTNDTTFTTSVNDLGLHNILVSVRSTQNVKSETFTFQLVEEPIYINDSITPQPEEPESVENVFGGAGEIITNDIGETSDNIVGFFGDLTNGGLSIIIPVGLFLFVLLMIGGTMALIR